LRAHQMKWVSFDPSWLVALAQEQLPDEKWLPKALAACRSCSWESRAYAHFVDNSNPNQPGSKWQFERNLVLFDAKEGELVLDVLTERRIGGVEFLQRL